MSFIQSLHRLEANGSIETEMGCHETIQLPCHHFCLPHSASKSTDPMSPEWKSSDWRISACSGTNFRPCIFKLFPKRMRLIGFRSCKRTVGSQIGGTNNASGIVESQATFADWQTCKFKIQVQKGRPKYVIQCFTKKGGRFACQCDSMTEGRDRTCSKEFNSVVEQFQLS